MGVLRRFGIMSNHLVLWYHFLALSRTLLQPINLKDCKLVYLALTRTVIRPNRTLLSAILLFILQSWHYNSNPNPSRHHLNYIHCQHYHSHLASSTLRHFL